MLFKTLEIQGFKSFADKTVLEFDTRTTAVVGPNGNGKSNISDALRWVMGEQGAKTLRGEKMDDVIFHGTVERKPMGFARVALTIDNSDRTLSVDSDEVVISRKLYHDGRSEYLINGKISRLRDIQELLLGTGLGRDGYSIIGQGRVDEIIKARDTQRREIFEEAAGVSRYIHQKAEAERDLAKAEENIVRQRELMHFDEEQLPKLKAQSEKAVRFNELMTRRKTLEVSVSAAHLKEKRGELKRIDDGILLNQGQCENFDRDIQKAEKQINDLGDEKFAAQTEMGAINKEIRSDNEELAEKNAAIAVAKNNIENNKKRRRELKEQLENAEQSERNFKDNIAGLNRDIEKKQSEADEAERLAEQYQKELDSITEESARAGKEFSDLEVKLAKALSEKGQQEIARSRALETAEKIEQQKSDFLEGIKGSVNDLANYRRELEEARKKSAETADELTTVQNRSAGMERLAEGKKKRFEEARKASEEADRLLNDKNQRYRFLADVEKNREGYHHAVKEVLRAGDQGRLTGIHGTVANVITVPEKYVTAIETVLSGVMQNVIVDNADTAARCIYFLSDNNFGRATFYPLTTIKGRRLNEPRLASEDGFEGIASELVECDDEYAQIISNLLGTTAVVDDLSAAKVIGEKYGYRFRIVTLDGQVVNAGGSFTGGSREKKGISIISRKQEMDALYSEISKLKESVKAKKAEFDQYKAEKEKSDIELDGLQDQIHRLEQDEKDTAAEIKRLEALIEQLEGQDKSSRQNIRSFDDQINAQNEIISEAENKIKELSEQIAGFEKSKTEQSGEKTETEKKISEISEKLSAANNDRGEALHAINLLKNDIKNLEDNRRRTLENSSNDKKAMEELDTEDRGFREEIERIELEIKEQKGSVADKEKRINELTDKISSIEIESKKLRDDITMANNEKHKFSVEKARLEERKDSIQKEYDKIVKLLYDSYGLSVSEAEEQMQPLDDLKRAEMDLEVLIKSINALGSVNPESIEEYRKVSERNEFQRKQLGDIENSKRELEQLITQLTKEIKQKFLESFNDINRHFKNIFTQIFGPESQAELELTDPENVLSSGVEIKAAPPGKVIKTLLQLSGGEQAMVAMTIYFAILMHRPTPFCMLDEEDAPLDDVNVEKYIRYINQFSHSTQLMVISHKRGTIEGCAVLYGVYMQEKGVSRLLRKELTDALDDVTS